MTKRGCMWCVFFVNSCKKIEISPSKKIKKERKKRGGEKYSVY